MLLDGCARLHLGRRRWGSYRVLGTLGYAGGLSLVTALEIATAVPLVDRILIAIVPGLALFFGVKASEIAFGYERIVFYEQLLLAVGLSALALWIAGAHVANGVDLVTLGVGTFLAFGRIGCFMVACCHGRPWRWGVRYTPAHADAGFTRRWVRRPLFPIQLVDSLLSASAVAAGTLVFLRSHPPGAAAAVYLCIYGAGRFVLELFRGDSNRPYWLGVSEAQWTAVATTWTVVALAGPTLPRLAVAAALTAGAAALIVARRRLLLPRYWLTSPAHVEELHRLRLRATPDGAAAVTTLGLRLSLRTLPGGELHDYVISHLQRPVSTATARALARQLGLDAQVRPGATAGLVHLLVDRRTEQVR
jgi:hypothetical protein